MTVPVRYIQYGFGQHRIFYMPEEGGNPILPLTVHCYFPNKENKTITLKQLDPADPEIYYFDVFFRLLGNHLFVFFENETKTGLLNAIIKDRMA